MLDLCVNFDNTIQPTHGVRSNLTTKMVHLNV